MELMTAQQMSGSSPTRNFRAMVENTETHAATFQGDAMALDETGILSWLHFGDLHITEQHAENYRDFLALINHANTHVAGAVDFAVLPGDNAEKGTEEQYRLVRRAVDKLDIPLFVISFVFRWGIAEKHALLQTCASISQLPLILYTHPELPMVPHIRLDREFEGSPTSLAGKDRKLIRACSAKYERWLMHAQRANAQRENQSSKHESSERQFERPNPFSVNVLMLCKDQLRSTSVNFRHAAKAVAWPSGSAARQYTALPDRHGSLRRRTSPEPQTHIAWSRCQVDELETEIEGIAPRMAGRPH
jgi:hypothetical protein